MIENEMLFFFFKQRTIHSLKCMFIICGGESDLSLRCTSWGQNDHGHSLTLENC